MVTLLLLCISLVFIGFGVYRLQGPVSVWYIAYGIATVEFNYVAIPAGIAMAIWALATLPFVPDDWQLNLLVIGIASGLLGIVLARYLLKPSWLKWLEREHSDIIPLIQQEIEVISPRKWDHQVSTQEDLEEWVESFRRRHRLEKH